MRRLCGYDLNGWRDQAARNWRVQPGGDVEEIDTLVSAGRLASVVLVGRRSTGKWIGGAQAALAPHGRGTGWGGVGRPDRRRAVRDLLCDAAAPTAPLTAALAGLAGDCANGVLALDDVPRSDETMQERLLAALRAAGVRDGLVVWRPVLVALDAIRRGVVEREQTVGVICHDREGFSVQALRIRQEGGRARDLLAPERRQAGILSPSPCGYADLVERAGKVVAQALDAERRAPRVETSRALGRLALGAAAEPEILRLDNGDWVVLEPPAAPDPPRAVLSEDALARLRGCERLFFETLAEGDPRRRLQADLEAQIGRPLDLVPGDAVPRGALEAARRRARGDPVYFDFLPRIWTIVQVRQEPGAVSYDLVGADETLPAGRRYRSPAPARLGLQPGQDRISVYLCKEAAEWPRQATVELGTTVSQATPIDLWVEQTPAAGSAQILLRSPALAKQHTVDWDTAEEIHEDWDTLVERLAMPMPTIPARLVLPCGMRMWRDGAHGSGLVSLLAENVHRKRPGWNVMARQLSNRPEGFYCISSDGDLPSEVPATARTQLAELTERAVAELEDQIAGRADPDTGPLKFLTWQFRRCPSRVTEHLIDVVNGKGRLSTILSGNSSHMMLALQGVGRITAKVEHERKVLATLLASDMDTWVFNRETACVAFLLSRSETAPTLLERLDIDRLVARVLQDFHTIRAGEQHTLPRYRYAAFLLVGLLRWRLVDRYALVVGRDPAADALDTEIGATLPNLRRAAAAKPSLHRYVDILADTQNELHGEGTNPHILFDIYNSASS